MDGQANDGGRAGRGPTGRGRAGRARVGLRPVALGDLEHFKRWWADPEADYYDSGVVRQGPGDDFLDRIGRLLVAGGLPPWRVIEVAGVGPVGYVLHRGLDRWTGSVEMAIRLGREHWGKGYGTAATRLFTQYLFTELGVKRVWLEVADFNERARRMYASAGFVETARRPARRGQPGIIVMGAKRAGITPAHPGHTKVERERAKARGGEIRGRGQPPDGTGKAPGPADGAGGTKGL